MTNAVNARELALDTLIEVMEKNGLSHIVIRQTLTKYQYLEKKERSFYSRLSQGAIEHAIFIDYIIDQYSNTPVRKQKPLIRNLLRTGVYQILFMDSVPDAAACNECVKLATKRGFGQLKGFVNGVLRNISRGKENLKLPNASEDLVKHLSVAYSMPEWLVEKFIYELGAEETSIVLKAFIENEKRLCVRCNTSKATVEEIIDKLESEGVKVTASNQYKSALFIEDYDYLEKLETFRQGLIQVQDISSMLVACVAAPKEADMIIDACAAPGGKTMQLADMTKGKATIISRDVSDKKVDYIRENLDRAGFTNVKAQVWDGTCLDKTLIEKADVVVADVPCSGFGIIGKKPDIKYKASAEGCKSLVQLQRDICATVTQYVKKDGTFVYSTCTINADENVKNVQWIEQELGLRPIDISERLPKALVKDTTKNGYIQILPGDIGGDGFFIAGFKKL